MLADKAHQSAKKEGRRSGGRGADE
jgi:hypothetical protein